MNKQELIREIKKSSESEGFITASQFARFIGVSNVSQCKYKYLSGLDKVDGKYYFIPDVAAALMNHIS
jgi:hypothetical protein